MTMVLVLLLVGLLLYLIPLPGPTAGKVNNLGLVLVFWCVYFLIAGFGGRALRFADALDRSGFAASNEGEKPEQSAASASTGARRLPEGFPSGQHI